MKFAIGLLSFFIAHSLMAQTRGDLLDQIRNLSNAIEGQTYVTQANNLDLFEAQRKLAEAYNLLQKAGGPSDPQVYKQCVAWSFEVYKWEMNQGDALDRAQRKCQNTADLQVAQFLYDKHYRDLNRAHAMDLALTQANFEVKHRLDIIDFAYDKHFRDVSSSPAATRARNNAAVLPDTRNGLTCLKKFYPIYFRDNTSTVAMDKAAAACARNP
ncbi:MAG: hypothetical protein OHK0056_25580 [Bacteriovoracaceae bacterium]